MNKKNDSNQYFVVVYSGSRMINGIIDFDRKLFTPPRRIYDRSPGPAFWSMFLVVYSVFLVMVHKHVFDMLTIRSNVISHVIEFVFVPPRLTDFCVTISSCFYLCHLGHRFSALNATWRSLLVDDPDNRFRRRTTTETAVLVESVRLMHAELSGLLRKFNKCYGPMILSTFVFFIFDLTCDLYYILFFESFKLGFGPCLNYGQNMLFVVCLVNVASWTNDMVTKTIYRTLLIEKENNKKK